MVARLGCPVVLLFAASCLDEGQQRPSVAELLQQFETTTVFWRQFDVAKAIVAANNTNVLPELQSWLAHEERHLRGNAAFVFDGLGASRVFDVIAAILRDYSERWEGQGIPGGRWSIQGQIRADRYYAAHLLGDLKDPRAIPILVPLLKDPGVNFIVPWSLSQIGDKSAIQPLIGTLSDRDPSMRVLAIYALADLGASEALPKLRELLTDYDRCNFGKLESVAQAAQSAIAKLSSEKR